ncbi:hypothetical protein BZA77DRAFT_292659 [Pyronema omphalodes]|nr:hypothetical protein BZA77DRAFT_292659 [Pyronema omphalodes]
MENLEIVGYDYLAEKQEKQKSNEGREKKDEEQKKDGQDGGEGSDEKKKTGENEDKDKDEDKDDGDDEGREKEEGAETEEQENAEDEEINEEEMIEEVTSMESSDRGFYENLPNFETEEELHQAIYMRQFTMHRLDHDIQVTNRYAQWLSTRVENGERVRNTLEDDIWEIPNWVSEYSGSEDEGE